MKRLSVIIPTLNEAMEIGRTLDALGKLRGDVEVIVVDGGSVDGTLEIVTARKIRAIQSVRGRGSQLHAGAVAATGDVLWFLHADTLPPSDATEKITAALSNSDVVAGNFTVRFDGEGRPAKFLTWLYPHLRKLGLVYGDSAIFMRREVYESIGGIRALPIFEDVDSVRRLRGKGRFACLPREVVCSSRRFEGRSFACVFLRWVILQVLFWLGVSPERLVKSYFPVRKHAKK